MELSVQEKMHLQFYIYFLKTRCLSLLIFGLDSLMALVDNTYMINGCLNYLILFLLLYLKYYMLCLMKCILLLNISNGVKQHIIYLKRNLMSMFSLDNNQFLQLLNFGFGFLMEWFKV